MLGYGGAAFADGDLAVVRAAVNYTLQGQRADGCMPDRVQADGTPVYGPGGASSPFADHALDNMPFATLLVDAYLRRYGSVTGAREETANSSFAAEQLKERPLAAGNLTPDASDFFCAALPRLIRALSFLPRSADGLVYNDPAAPNCTYGFTDTVAKQGRLLFTSLLVIQAEQALARWSNTTGCGNATTHAAEASRVAAAVAPALYDAASQLFLACDTGANSLPDVWGSALAVAVGAVPANNTTRVVAALAQTLAGDGAQAGQIRHLLPGQVWGKCFRGSCPANGTYQNGAYWATPLAWIAPVLQTHGESMLAKRLLDDTATSFGGGVMECVNADLRYHGVTAYVASATNALAGAGG